MSEPEVQGHALATSAPPILQPGDYLVELESPARAYPAAVAIGVKNLGFAHVAVDAPPRAGLVGAPFRFVARLTAPLAVKDSPNLRWSLVRRLSIDILAPLKPELFSLKSEKLYEVRFLCCALKRKDLEPYDGSPDPERQFMVAKLAEIGWETVHLSVLERGKHVERRPDTELTMWFGLLRWTGPDSVVTDDEPFSLSFEDVVQVPA